MRRHTKAIVIFAAAGFWCIAALPPASAQTFDEMASAGEEAMNAGRYADAIRHYEKIVATGVTYENILAVKFDLSWAYYSVGSFDKAIPLLKELAGPRAPSEAVKQQSLFLLAECHARLAETQPENSSERKQNLKEALELHTKFQTEYPKNQNIPQSLYGRAYAYYLNGEYDKAENDLKKVITEFRTTPTAVDAYYLLASVYSQQALVSIKNNQRDAAKPFLDKARELFKQLAKQQSNLAMANDSMFSLAETWFTAGFYREAIGYFREVRSKNEVLQSLRKSAEILQNKLGEALAQKADTRQIQTELNRIRAQIATVTETPDRMIAAYLRIADAFYRLQRYDEVRVICRHLMNFAQDNQKIQAGLLLVNTFLEERNPEEAAQAFAEFQQNFGTDVKLAESINLAIGQLFVLQGKLEQALEQLTRSVQDYPESQTFEDALYLKFTTEYMLGRYNDVKASVDQYTAKFPNGKHLPTGLYYKGMSQAALEEGDAALATLTDVITRFPEKTEDFQNIDEVAYQKGALLVQQKKDEEAIKHFQDFIERYKDSKLRPFAMYQLGVALNRTGKAEEAENILRQVGKDHPDADIAPTALFQIGVMYFEKEKFEEMAKVMQEILQQYPNKPIVTDAYFWLGFVAKRNGAYDDAIGYFRKAIESNPQADRAPECLLSAAQSHSEKADKMGLPTVLPEDKRVIYKDARLGAAKTFEELLEQYPTAAQALDAIPGIAKEIFELVRYKQMTPEEAEAYFKEASARHAQSPELQAQLLFSRGRYLMQSKEKSAALASFKEALKLKPDVRISPEMLSDYAEALKEDKQLAEAEKIYNKILEDYADSPHAVAPAWFGLADIKYLQENFEEAKNLFQKVLTEFPWFERGKQGRVKLAAILERNQDYAAAEQMFTEVWREEKGEARIGASLGVARCQLAKAEREKRANSPAWRETARVASENLTKITVLFEAYPEYVSEAYWQLGRACELVGDVDKAKEMYRTVVEKYSKFPSAKSAGEQLRRLGG